MVRGGRREAKVSRRLRTHRDVHNEKRVALPRRVAGALRFEVKFSRRSAGVRMFFVVSSRVVGGRERSPPDLARIVLGLNGQYTAPPGGRAGRNSGDQVEVEAARE